MVPSERRRPPQRGDSLDSHTGSVAEGRPPRRRVLRRARNVLTTQGQPVPAIAVAAIRVEPPSAPARPKTSMSNGTAGRPHSNSVPAVSSSSSGPSSRGPPPPPPGEIARRRSDGSASLGVGGSIRRTLKGVVSKSRSRSRDKAPDAAEASLSPVRRSISFISAPRGVPSDTAPQLPPTHRKTSIKGHIRSASDVISSWTRPPRIAASVSEPLPGRHPSPQTSFEAAMVTTQQLVGSPDEIPSALQAATDIQDPTDDPSMLTGAQPLTPTREPPPPVDTTVSPACDVLSPQSSTSAAATDDVPIPPLLLNGVPMMKVSAKKQKRYFFRLDPDEGHIVWYSKKLHLIPIESIKEIRTGSDARYYREQFQLAASYEDKWLTIIYILDGSYKTLHLIAATRDIFQMWDLALHRLYDIRKQLMSGLGHGALRQVVWERQFWKGADEEKDQKLDFDDIERMCRRLNINPSRDDLLRRFKQADTQKRGYLDFSDFRKFVKALKARPEVDRLFKRLCYESGSTDDTLRYPAFATFMREHQKSTLSEEELQRLFVKYASLSSTSSEEASADTPSSPARNALELAIHSAAITAGLNPGTPNVDSEATPGTSALPADTSSSPLPAPPPAPLPPRPTHETGVLTAKMFTTFLLSADNGAFRDERHDMSRPLPEYYISSSHNTYLVGHQLVGESTIEGYIRALLHSCRSVEVDIYDGESEPVIYHGKTFTTKVPLRDICQAIARYAFVASPYPIIISAEVHCGLAQQSMIAAIMSEVFGDALIKCSPNERPKIEALPSPEDLKGKVMLKTKNLYISTKEDTGDKEVAVETESSSTETASDNDIREEIRHEWRKAREGEVEVMKGFESGLTKAKKIIGHINPRRPSNSSSPRPAPSPNLAAARSGEKPKVKMSMDLVSLLVYTVGVKCRGLNKKEVYAPEHMFSLSENSANKLLKQGMIDLIKHCRTHLVRIYPKGIRIGSTNYEPHRYWSAGAQLVALNWQTFDLGYMINHAMFQRNQRAGYVLKPPALRTGDKALLAKRTRHFLDVTIISAQQLPRAKNAQGREIIDRGTLDPFVEVSVHIPDWTQAPFLPAGDGGGSGGGARSYSPAHNTSPGASGATSARTVVVRTGVVKNNGFNPVWEQSLSLPFDCVGDMLDLVFVRFAVRQEDKDDEEPVALYCTSLASLNAGYRHLPLHDCQLSQYLFSTLFIHTNIRDA